MLFRTIALLLLVVLTATVAVTQKSLAYSPAAPQPKTSMVSIPAESTTTTTTPEQLIPLAAISLAPDVEQPDPLIAQVAGITNYAGRTLAPAERNRLETFLRSKNINTTSPFFPPGNPRFIIHDTAVILPLARLEQEQREGRGPLGLGVSIYAPRTSNAVVARPNFYELRRPTTTQFEKAADVLVQSQRESLFRRIWRSTTAVGRKQALDRALSNLNLQPGEIATEQKKAAAQLSSSSDKVFTTATWTVESVCNAYNGGDKLIANSGDLDAACRAVKTYFTVRNQRVNNSVPIEILQVGAKSSSGNQNSCNAQNSNLIPFSRPPYTDIQYESVLLQYLRATFLAGKYPEATTHFVLDHGLPESHCDPRCFNMNKLYRSIAAEMGHPQNSRYGITPSYGTKPGTNSIWWNENFCHGSFPS
jgi:hypothetical protein